MNVVSLLSGGKDSVYATYLAEKKGLNVTNFLSMFSEKKDSWMFHTVNIHMTKLQAEAMNIPLTIKKTRGEKEKELKDLKNALLKLNVDGVVSGTIASTYQKSRIKKICDELELESFTPLWHKKQDILLKDIVKKGFEVIIIGVFAEGLEESWLGRKIDNNSINDLKKIEEKYMINTAGEGGEFETLVLDSPLFEKKIVIDKSEKVWNRDNGYLIVKKAFLEKK
jgi:diphthine-ammonia ligase